jgi:hypothetical protein
MSKKSLKLKFYSKFFNLENDNVNFIEWNRSEKRQIKKNLYYKIKLRKTCSLNSNVKKIVCLETMIDF